jgi:hypothetical protein
MALADQAGIQTVREANADLVAEVPQWVTLIGNRLESLFIGLVGNAKDQLGDKIKELFADGQVFLGTLDGWTLTITVPTIIITLNKPVAKP